MPEMVHDESAGQFPVRLLVPNERATVAQLTALALARAPEPAMFDTHAPIFWTVEASNNRIDSYSTHMDVSTLKNYEADAKDGVSFQDGHLTDGIVRTLGQSIGARYIGPNAAAREAGIAAVEVDFYTLLGLDPAIDAFVNKAQAGLIRDVSVGFYGGWYRCDICQRDMQDYADYNDYCPHVPGRMYPVFDDNGKATKDRKLCTAGVMDAHLAEVSGVYSGSTPEASILVIKARSLAEAGLLPREDALSIQRQFRVDLPGTTRAFPGATFKKEETVPAKEAAETRTPEEIAHERAVQDARTSITAEMRPAILDVLRVAGITAPEGDDLLPHLRALGTVIETRDAEIARLKPLADAGVTYRKDLVDGALDDGRRALGNGFSAEMYRTVLAAAPLETVKRMRADWKQAGDKLFPGGRATGEAGAEGEVIAGPKEEEESSDEVAAARKTNVIEYPVPMSAFRAGR